MKIQLFSIALDIKEIYKNNVTLLTVCVCACVCVCVCVCVLGNTIHQKLCYRC